MGLRNGQGVGVSAPHHPGITSVGPGSGDGRELRGDVNVDGIPLLPHEHQKLLSLRKLVLVSPDLPEELFIPRDLTTRTLVGVDHSVVDAQLIDATAPANEFRGDSELSLNSRRQTGGHREIVSFDAVFDPDL